MTPLDDDRPTLLLFGDGEPMLDALVAALSGRALVMVEDEAESAVAAVLANVPDVTVFVGRAAEPERAAALLRELGAHALTASSPVALLSSDDSLAARLRAAEHGVVTIVQRSASADAMARQMLELATRLYDDPGVHEAGELAEASVDDLVQILGRELQSGILSITQTDGARAERFVVRAGQPMRAAISQFIERVRPLIAEAKPLHYAFHEAPVAPLWTLDDEAEAEADGSARKSLRERRFLLIANNPAAADALAQELRANGSLVVVVSADGSGWDRARDLDPEIALIDEEGLNHWGFDAVARLRADPQLRWASLVVMDAKELLPDDGPPRVERLAANIAKLTEPDAALRARAAAHEVFDTRIETVGPTRLVRALLSTGGAWNLQVRPRGGATLQLALAEGLVAGASAQLPDGRHLEAAAAFACLLVAGAGRLRAEPATHPKLANMLMPLDEAVRAAHAEGSPVPVTHSPSAPPPPPERSSRPSSPPRARAATSQTHSTETSALVGELEELVGGLHEALEGQPTRPKTTARVAVPKPPARPAAAPPVAAAPAGPKPAVATASPAAAKPSATVRAEPARAAAGPPRPPASGAASPSVPRPPAPAAPATSAPAARPAAPATPATSAPAARPAATASAPAAGPGRPAPLGASTPSTARPTPATSASPAGPAPARATAAAPPPATPAERVASAASPAAAAPPPAPAVAGAARPTSPAAAAPPPAPAVAGAARPTPPLAAATSLPTPPPAGPARSLPPPPATRTSLPPPLSEDAKPTLPPLPNAALAPHPQAPPTTRPPPPPVATPVPTPAQAAASPPAAPPPTLAPPAASAPAAPAPPAAAPPAPRPVPMPQPPPTALANPPQPVLAPPAMAQPVTSADEAPRRKVSPMHVAIALGVVLAGIAGFALVFTFAAQRQASEANHAAPVAVPVDTPTPAASPAPPAPASPDVTPPAFVHHAPATAAAPGAQRLPSVDPGPMPEEHAGAAATVERYRESLARGARARSRGDLEVALSSYRFAVHLKPRSTDALLGVARTYLDAQQPADALRWAERARDVETRGIEGRLVVGDALLAMGQHDRAIATWREAQALAPRERAPEERIQRAEEDLAEED